MSISPAEARTARRFPAPLKPLRRQLSANYLASNLLIVAALQSLLPRLTDTVNGTVDVQVALSIVLVIGTIGPIVGNPIAGALSDRTVSRFGRRRPWILVGGLAASGLLIVLAYAPTLAALAVAWLAVQFAINAHLGGIQAVVPDQVPTSRRATVTGWIGASQSIGSILAVVILSYVVLDLTAGALVIAAVTATLIAVTTLRMYDQPVQRTDPGRPAAVTLGSFFSAFWISPRQHPDFAWAWAARFAFSLGAWLGTTYLLFYVIERTGLEQEPALQLHTQLIAANVISVIVFSVITGYWSDRLGRRRPFLIGFGLVSVVGAVLLAVADSSTVMLAAAALLGAGFGSYMGVDQALVTQILPSAADRGRALGVFQISLSLPQLIAPVVGFAVFSFAGTTSSGYLTLYLLTAAAILVGSVLILKIRDVR